MSKKVAVVTGGNRGIGLAICRGLARDASMRVVLTARSADSGEKAAAELRGEGLDVRCHPLDVTDESSIQALAAFLKREFGGLDVLVNNAGINLQGADADILTTTLEQARETIETNTLAPLRLTQVLAPLMAGRGGGRVVNVSSQMGQLATMSANMPSYRLSKTALNAVTRMLAEALQPRGILVNCMCPGWVRTDMGGANAPRTPEEGADTAIFLATLPDDGPTGRYFQDREELDW